jgi:sensor histidine kinase YesM
MILKRSVIIGLHVAYWLTYLLLITLFVAATLQTSPTHRSEVVMYVLFTSALPMATLYPAIAAFYISYFILFRFLQRKRFLILTGAGLAAAIIPAILAVAVIFLKTLTPKPLGLVELIAMTGVIALVNVIHGTLALVTRGFINWYGDIRVKEQLTQKNYETELALMRSQLNPHFLFNTIHNIDILIEKDPPRASGYLNRLSDIMRFMLYETRAGRIPLARELTYIEKYIDLQKIRSANPNYVSYQVEGDPGNLMIEPMLFIPFIENAFKHGEDRKREEAIRISFRIEQNNIVFECGNRYNSQRVPDPDSGHGGLGNGLIKKRLHLLYPGMHSLDLDISNDIYKVKLTLHGNIH